MQGWGVVSRPLFSGRSNSPYPMILGTLGSGCAEAQWEMKERRSGAGCRGPHRPVPRVSLKGILPVLQLSRLFPIFPRLSRAGLGAPSPSTPPPLGTPGAASSPGIGKFVTFPAQASPRAGVRCKGPSRKCGPGLRRKRPASSGAGDSWRRHANRRIGRSWRPCLSHRPAPRFAASAALPAGVRSLPSAPRYSLQTLPGAGHGRRRRRCRRSSGRIPRAGG